MKKIILVTIALLFGILLLLPSPFDISKKIEIQIPQEVVYSYLVNLEDWQQWSPWLEKDPTARFDFSGIPGIVGSSSYWKGNEIGEGRQTLTKLEEPNSIETQLTFIEPSESQAIGYIELQPTNTGTLVTWGLRGRHSGPIEKVIGLFMETFIGPDLEKGLQNLKQKLENSQVPEL